MSTTMLPHPTTSSLCSAIAMGHLERGRPSCARVGLADPSALEHGGAVVAKLAEANLELATFFVAKRRGAVAEQIAGDHAELLQRGFEACDSRDVRLAAALESTRRAEVADHLRVEMHQLAVGGAADLPCALPLAGHR